MQGAAGGWSTPHAGEGAWSRGLALLVCALLPACATIPDGRYGVDELALVGVEQLDVHALEACLATRERPRLKLDLSRNPNPNCGEPPFDARHLELRTWRWPWTDWPLYEPSVFERDLARIERWYKARGFYGVRILKTEADPSEALYGTPSDEETVRLRITIEEGDPVRIDSVSVSGLGDLDDDLAEELFNSPELETDGRFDEASYDTSKARLLRTLHNAGYAQARVVGRVDVDPKALTANVQYNVRPGPFTEFGSVCIEGYGDMPARLILQASGLTPGAAFSDRELEEARTRIYQMRVFSEVEVRLKRGGVLPGDQQPEGQRDGEWMAWQSDDSTGSEAPPADDRVCRNPEGSSAHPRIPVEIRVKSGRLYRYGVGAGFQIGVADGERAVTDTTLQQWDVHLMAYLEVRNFLGGLRRLRIEERPRLVFPDQFPRLPPRNRQARTDEDGNVTERVYLGNTLEVTLDWPAFIEDRTLLRILTSADTGPDPYGGGFRRHDLNLLLGPQRDFLHNRVHLAFNVGFNLYRPFQNDQAVRDEAYTLYFLQQVLAWDSRNDPSSPTRGVLARLELHESLPPSRWLYVRATPELRGFIPLPLGLVVAVRAGMGALWIYDPNTLDPELDRLGPRPYRLRGGGPYSVRGIRSGLLGLADPSQNQFSGGTRSWIASIELRVPLGESLGMAFFADAGDVDAGRGAGTDDDGNILVDDNGAPLEPGRRPRWRWDHPHLSVGAGLRYKTIVGPLRVDVAWLVPGVQGDPAQQDPWFGFNGGVHITIGEAF